MTARLNNTTPSLGANGPFFERGEFGEIGAGTTVLFGANPTSISSANTALIATADMNKTFDHSREELFRRIAQMICTRGDTFTVYAVGQSIQTTATGAQKVTGTQRLRVTFRLVPKAKNSKNGFVRLFPSIVHPERGRHHRPDKQLRSHSITHGIKRDCHPFCQARPL